MRAVDFVGSDRVIAKNQQEYRNLPAYYAQGRVTTFWKPSIWDRIRMVFGGGIWLQVLTFGNPLQPLMMATEKPNIGNG